jgi:MerR family mercuric resistance operon transcriptional regulator
MRGPSEVARLAGIHVETLRYYEDVGLLPPPARTAAGRRLYDDDTVALLQSIRAARSFGLGIDDILSVLATLERTLSELARLEERRQKLEAILAEVRAAPPGKGLKDRVRSAWRRVDGPRRSLPRP